MFQNILGSDTIGMTFFSEMVRQMEVVKLSVKIHMVDSSVLAKVVSSLILMKNHALILTSALLVMMTVTVMPHVPILMVPILVHVKLDSLVMARTVLLQAAKLDSFSMERIVLTSMNVRLD